MADVKPVTPGLKAEMNDTRSAPDEATKKRLTGDLDKVAKGDVGNINSVNDQMKKSGMWDQDVDVSKLPESLRSSAPKGAKKWSDVANGAAEAGWKHLDTLIGEQVKGNFSRESELIGLLDGQGAELNTGNIRVMDTADGRLNSAKDYIKTLTKVPGGDPKKLTVSGVVAQLHFTKFDQSPTHEGALMKNFEIVAKGKHDGAAGLAAAINGGKVLGRDGKPINGASKIAYEYIASGSKLDKLLGENKYDITYGKLLDIVHNEGTSSSSDKKDSLSKNLAKLSAAIDPMLIDNSPGNDRRTIMQNLDGLGKDLDVNNPNSKFSEINTLYGRVIDDINALQGMDINSPSHNEFMKETVRDLEEIQNKTGRFFEKAGNYFSMAKDNMKNIQKREEKEAMWNAIAMAFSGLAALGSIGFGVSNGFAVAKQFKAGGFVNTLKGNSPALFGSGTLFANNAANVGIAADKQSMLQDLMKLSPDLAKFGGNLSTANSYLKKAYEGMVTNVAAAEYHINNWDRYEKYMAWATKKENRDKSSLYNKDANDSAYDGPMPYRFWKPGEFSNERGVPLSLYRVFMGGRGATKLELKAPPPPDWAK